MLLSAPRTARLVIRCRAYSVAVRGNRSIRLFSTSGKLNEPTEASPQEIFPWKSELRPRGWTDRVQSFIRVFWAKRAFNKITLSEEDKGELRHAVVGSLWALKSAVAGIFEHSHMRKHFESTKETNNLRIDGVLNQELAPINIREIFEENLLQFFNTAIEKHCAQNKRLCIYSLLKVHGAALTNVEVVICMQRGNKIPAYVRPKTFYGATVLWPFESFFGFGDQGMETKLVDELLDAYEPDKNTTVRVMADVQCSGVTKRPSLPFMPNFELIIVFVLPTISIFTTALQRSLPSRTWRVARWCRDRWSPGRSPTRYTISHFLSSVPLSTHRFAILPTITTVAAGAGELHQRAAQRGGRQLAGGRHRRLAARK